ncbi:P27 family phage terminase small subunit [Bradyrhizobium manausense]|uniref:Uncharacterized protein n=1 Tax=Bradyrhizobium manausense TaxID=989370 RepID=A0A0R3CXT2_9BRAD|nr:P27 family phage terminase small subunit [Bradyrhizobium manausense]KRQ02411.1 hypothetical protein AOQ71_34895 [Bradyrhizobium manausense]
MFEEHVVKTTAAASILQSGLEAHQRARVARETIDREGMTCTGRDGQPKQHPLLAVERDARAAFLQALKVLDLEL